VCHAVFWATSLLHSYWPNLYVKRSISCVTIMWLAIADCGGLQWKNKTQVYFYRPNLSSLLYKTEVRSKNLVLIFCGNLPISWSWDAWQCIGQHLYASRNFEIAFAPYMMAAFLTCVKLQTTTTNNCAKFWATLYSMQNWVSRPDDELMHHWLLCISARRASP